LVRKEEKEKKINKCGFVVVFIGIFVRQITKLSAYVSFWKERRNTSNKESFFSFHSMSFDWLRT